MRTFEVFAARYSKTIFSIKVLMSDERYVIRTVNTSEGPYKYTGSVGGKTARIN